jgi:hypothetical protein
MRPFSFLLFCIQAVVDEFEESVNISPLITPGAPQTCEDIDGLLLPNPYSAWIPMESAINIAREEPHTTDRRQPRTKDTAGKYLHHSTLICRTNFSKLEPHK